MNRRIALTALPVALCLGLTAPAVAATASPSAQHSARVAMADRSFAKGNEQVNLAEITLAKIVLDRSQNPYAQKLAKTTMADHKKARRLLEGVAKQANITLPTAPNAMQAKIAAELKKMPAHDVAHAYFKAQVAGHKTSIAATRKELNDGSNQNVLKYARVYLPIAQMHLKMSKRDLQRWNRTH